VAKKIAMESPVSVGKGLGEGQQKIAKKNGDY